MEYETVLFPTIWLVFRVSNKLTVLASGYAI